jgi:ketosteroid isomerase-like protein
MDQKSNDFRDAAYESFENVCHDIDLINKEWLVAVNKKEDIKKFYKENVVLYLNNEFCQGDHTIEDFYCSHLNTHLTKFHVEYRTLLPENEDMVYETGYFSTTSMETFQYLAIWSKTSGTWLRELEAVSIKKNNLEIGNGIADARNLWIEYANKNSAIALAQKTYTEDFLYFNRGNKYRGYDNLAEIYSYMNDKDFHVTLNQDINVMIQEDLSFEIGTWTSEGKGKYIIIWKKQENGEWKILLDSNW